MRRGSIAQPHELMRVLDDASILRAGGHEKTARSYGLVHKSKRRSQYVGAPFEVRKRMDAHLGCTLSYESKVTINAGRGMTSKTMGGVVVEEDDMVGTA